MLADSRHAYHMQLTDACRPCHHLCARYQIEGLFTAIESFAEFVSASMLDANNVNGRYLFAVAVFLKEVGVWASSFSKPVNLKDPDRHG